MDGWLRFFKPAGSEYPQRPSRSQASSSATGTAPAPVGGDVISSTQKPLPRVHRSSYSSLVEQVEEQLKDATNSDRYIDALGGIIRKLPEEGTATQKAHRKVLKTEQSRVASNTCIIGELLEKDQAALLQQLRDLGK